MSKPLSKWDGYAEVEMLHPVARLEGKMNLNFDRHDRELKIASDTDGDLAVEGSYGFNDASSILFGWDNGFNMMEGFDDAALPAPVFAAPRGSAFEIALVQEF